MNYIKNALIYDNNLAQFKKSSIGWANDKINYVSKIHEDKQANEIISHKRLFVTPAFINPYSKVGIKEAYYDRVAGDDSNETSSILTPHYDTKSGINFNDKTFKNIFTQGFLSTAVSPGDKSLISGNIIVMNSYGKIIDEMIINEKLGLKGVVGARLKSIENPLFPKTRISTVALLRQSFYDALNYYSIRYEKKQALPINLLYESLIPVLLKNEKIFFHANRSDDIATVIRIKNEFNLKVVIIGGAEAYKIIDKVKENNIECIITLNSMYLDERETMNMSIKSLRQLIRQDICVGIASDYNLSDKSLIDSAKLLLRSGFYIEEVIKLITINAAKILDIDKKYGKLEEGANADFLVFEENMDFENLKYIIASGKIYNNEGELDYDLN
ncbi:MAG: amidohydrolase family protein [Clostridia bacterium]